MWRTVADQYYFTFRVKACADANIALSKYNGITDIFTYEITIGGDNNRITTIKEGIGGTVRDQRYTYVHIMEMSALI